MWRDTPKYYTNASNALSLLYFTLHKTRKPLIISTNNLYIFKY